MLARFVLLVAFIAAGCVSRGNDPPQEAQRLEAPSWQLIAAQGAGDGGTLFVVLRSPKGEVVSFDLRSPMSDRLRRLHLHLEPFEWSGYPDSKIVAWGSPEEHRYRKYVEEAIEPYLTHDSLEARERRFELSRLFVQAVFRWDDAKDADTPAEARVALKADLDRAMEASNAEPLTDHDWAVSVCQSVLRIMRERADTPMPDASDVPFPYNIGSFEP